MKNVAKNLLLGDSKVRIVVVRMGAGVNDSVHIQVQIVELRDLVLFYNLKTFLKSVSKKNFKTHAKKHPHYL